MGKFLAVGLLILVGLAFVLGIYAGLAWLLVALLNFVLPAFGLQVSLNIWHGLAILILLSIIGGALGRSR